MAMTNQETIDTIKANYPDKHYTMLREALDMAIEALEKQDVPETNVGEWISADNRPPSQGRYLVYGLTNFVPDHIDQLNAYWEVKIAYWSNGFGWDCKVKYWMPLPEPPKEDK